MKRKPGKPVVHLLDYRCYTKYVDDGVSALFVDYTKNLIKVTKEATENAFR